MAKEKYEPTPEEMKRAEDSLTDKQKEATRLREIYGPELEFESKHKIKIIKFHKDPDIGIDRIVAEIDGDIVDVYCRKRPIWSTAPEELDYYVVRKSSLPLEIENLLEKESGGYYLLNFLRGIVKEKQAAAEAQKDLEP